MATATFQRNKTLPDSSAKSDFHDLIDTATLTALGITNDDLASNAAITDSKLAAITTASKVSGAALYGLASIPSGAGVIPAANLPAAAANALTTDGAETITGVKTFSVSPIVPTPTTDYQASTKKYVDDAIAAAITASALPSTTAIASTYVKNTVYQNTSTTRKWLVIAYGPGDNDGYINGYVGNTVNPTTIVGRTYSYTEGSGGADGCVPIVVPPQWYFKFTSNGTPDRIESWEM